MTELSLTVPITNSLAFLFTVLGDWWVDSKVISRGMASNILTITIPCSRLTTGRYMDRDGVVTWRDSALRSEQDHMISLGYRELEIDDCIDWVSFAYTL